MRHAKNQLASVKVQSERFVKETVNCPKEVKLCKNKRSIANIEAFEECSAPPIDRHAPTEGLVV